MEFHTPIYPNQPLIDVVFEIRFPGEVRVECERHLFWEKIRTEYPKVLVPQTSSDKPLALLPYKFRAADDSMTVMVCMNSFAISATKYPGYDIFSKEILRVYRLFGDTFNINKINRIGWRYINVIPFVRNNGLIPLAKFLKLGFKIPASVPSEFKNINLMFESENDGISIITQLQSIQRQIASGGLEEALMLDFDFGRISYNRNDLEFKSVPKYLDEAHTRTRTLFEDFITDEYRQYLKGDVI